MSVVIDASLLMKKCESEPMSIANDDLFIHKHFFWINEHMSLVLLFFHMIVEQ
jgi:hypothetical protein